MNPHQPTTLGQIRQKPPCLQYAEVQCAGRLTTMNGDGNSRCNLVNRRRFLLEIPAGDAGKLIIDNIIPFYGTLRMRCTEPGISQ